MDEEVSGARRPICGIHAPALTLVLSAVVACAQVAPVAPVPAAEQAQPGGRLVIASTSDIETVQAIGGLGLTGG